MAELDGKEIVKLWTLKSYYDNNSVVAITAEDEMYRIKIEEFLKILNGLKFKKVKKRVHTYLEIEK